MKTDIYVSSLIWNSITYIITGKKFQQDLENSCSVSIEKALEGRVGMQDEILEQMEKQQDLKDRSCGWSSLRDHEITPRKPGLCSQFRKWMGVKGQDTRAKKGNIHTGFQSWHWFSILEINLKSHFHFI